MTVTMVNKHSIVLTIICICGIAEVVSQCTNCNSGACLSDQTCDSCKAGFYGSRCEEKCPSRCKSCEQDFENNEICHDCIDGFRNGLFYGTNYTDCSATCNIGCKECSVQTFNCSSCLSGYYYKQYLSYSRCLTCPTACKKCNSNTYCTSCTPGRYGSTCQNLCRGNCQLCSSWDTCEVCKPGFYGSYCQYRCTETCKTCLNATQCVACKDGFYGEQCEKCPSVCDQCDQMSPCEGCPDMCQIWTCSANCLSCSANNTCTSCKQGFYGNHCQNKCDISCKTCLDSTTHCQECAKGYYKNNGRCYKCPQNCEYCTWSYLCPVCKPGFYGYSCYSKCKSGCHYCTNETDCTVCQPGFGGHDCTTKCSPNCYSCYASGECTDCQRGYFGSHCQYSCPQGCYENTCDTLNGTCTAGCKSLYFEDESCSTCIRGTYGSDCMQTCSSNCVGNECDTLDGFCIKGCTNGYYGSQCEQRCSEECINNSCTQIGGLCNHDTSIVTMLLYVLIGLVAFFGIVMVVLRLTTFLRRCKPRRRNNNKTEMKDIRSNKAVSGDYENFAKEIETENDNYYTVPAE